MNRTVTALYETRAQAEQVRDALKAAHLGDHVDIRDQTAADANGVKEHHAFGAWLNDLFGGHHDRHLYGEGIRRGHFLLTAKVDDLNETRAAEILDAEAPVDLDHAHDTWRGEGWAPPVPSAVSALSAAEGVVESGGVAPATANPSPAGGVATGRENPIAGESSSAGSGVRIYPVVQ